MNNNNVDGFRRGLQKVTGAIQSSKPMNAISSGFISLMIVMMAGAIFTLIDAIPIDAYQAFLENTGLKAITSIPINVTMNLMALFVVFSIAHKMAEQYEKDGFSAGFIALMSFFALLPFTDMGPMIGLPMEILVIPTQWLGAGGVFVSIVVALTSARIYAFILDKKIYIKMPAGVPPVIEKSFAAVVPAIIILAIMLTVRFLFSFTEQGSMFAFIFSVVQQPLTGFAGASIPVAVVAILMIHILWFFGIHGGMVVMSLLMPIFTPLAIENLNAFQAGAEIPNMITSGTMMNFGMVTGSGITIGLVVAMLRAKSARYRTLGRLGIIPGICGINEPLIFGTPIILNLKFAIPFIAMPTLVMLIGLLLTSWGILPNHNGVGTPLGTPVIVMGFLTGGWRVALFQAAICVVSYFSYLPFFKKADAEAAAQEADAAKANETEV